MGVILESLDEELSASVELAILSLLQVRLRAARQS